jgi:hypothetical protein
MISNLSQRVLKAGKVPGITTEQVLTEEDFAAHAVCSYAENWRRVKDW